jgi:hypothetical protein
MENKTRTWTDSGNKKENWWGEVNSVKNSGFMTPSIEFLAKDSHRMTQVLVGHEE